MATTHGRKADGGARRSRSALRLRRGEARRSTPRLDGPSEQLRLIEFVWSGSTGVQPVLYLERHLLD
jgi:hypothetical protein